MQLSRDVQLLRDYAAAEAKRAGHGVIEPLHVAAALARKDAAGFASAFGDSASAAVMRALKGLPVASGPAVESPALTELLGGLAIGERSRRPAAGGDC
ncbi:MAG: hypothetical protein IPP98_06180 [Gemmatimonadetes bacterium]|nr:hypothetical protein [Gemmatimonadota bacterium]